MPPMFLLLLGSFDLSIALDPTADYGLRWFFFLVGLPLWLAGAFRVHPDVVFSAIFRGRV